jgi:hypothetical protein
MACIRAKEAFDMADSLRSLQIIGLHRVVPTKEEFREAVAIQWGDDLTGEELLRAEGNVREHFADLYLLEIEVEPANADIDWGAITQPIDGQPVANWQSPYEECPVDGIENRWAFFFHFLDRNRPLQTQLGDRKLPEVTPIPPHLQRMVYEIPG